MGRYTTVQAYSDNNPKLVHVSYDQAKGKEEGGEGKAGGKLIVEKTDQVMGSCAGAGSGEFHTYRAHRRREMHRVAAIEEEMKNDEAKAALEEAMEKGQKECEERTRKKAEKRKRKKQAKRGNAGEKKAKPVTGDPKNGSSTLVSPGGSASSSGTGSSSSDADAAEEFVYIPMAERAAAGGNGGAPAAYKNDGSFLEKLQKELAGSTSASRDASASAPVRSHPVAAT